MRNKLKEKRGSLSIIGAILCLIVVVILQYYLDMNKTSWVQNELQSIMDVSGINALQESINNDLLRKEILAVTENKSDGTTINNGVSSSGNTSVSSESLNKITKTNFEKELKSCVKVNNSIISAFNIERFKSTLEFSDWGINKTTSGTANKKAQLTLDSTIKVTLQENVKFDYKAHTETMYDAKTGTNFSISVAGQTPDGRLVVLVRTHSRVVYR